MTKPNAPTAPVFAGFSGTTVSVRWNQTVAQRSVRLSNSLTGWAVRAAPTSTMRNAEVKVGKQRHCACPRCPLAHAHWPGPAQILPLSVTAADFAVDLATNPQGVLFFDVRVSPHPAARRPRACHPADCALVCSSYRPSPTVTHLRLWALSQARAEPAVRRASPHLITRSVPCGSRCAAAACH